MYVFSLFYELILFQFNSTKNNYLKAFTEIELAPL